MQRRRRPIRFSSRRLEPLEPRLLLIGPGDDVGDTRALSLPLAYTYGASGVFSDEIGQPGDVDLFRLDLLAGDRVDLKLESTLTSEFPFFGLLRVFGEAAGIEQPDDHRLSFTAATDGSLHTGVSGFGNDQYDPDLFQEQGPPFTGNYRLEFTVTAGAAETPDDTLAGAQEIELNAGGTQTVTGQIDVELDVDIVAIQLVAGDVLRAKFDSGDALVRFFDPDGQELSNDPCLQVAPGETAITAQRAGLHYVAVSGAGNTTYDPHVANSGATGAIGDYQLTLTRETNAPLGDGDTLATARQLCYATSTLPRELTVNGEIATPSDVDLFRVELAAGEAIEATVLPGAASILNSVLRVFDATGRPVKDNIAAVDSGNENPPLRFGNAVGGTFYVGVSAVGNASYNPTTVNSLVGQSFGSYSLLARIVAAGPGDGELPPDEEAPIAPPRPVLLAETVTGGQLTSRNEVDTLPITVTVPSRLDARAILLSGAPANGSLELSDDAGNTILVSAPGDAKLSQHLAPGNYVLSVQAGASTALPLDYQLITRLTPATSVLEDYVAAEGLTALATGDFTDDGLIDAVLANGLENTLTFLVGLGDGTFAPQTPFTVNDAPSALAVADFTGDGRLDLAVGRRDSDRLMLFFGGANGWFDSAREVAVGAGVNALAVADFNGDGNADLAAAVGATRSVAIISGLQASADPIITTIPLADAASALAVGDFNQDGRQDIAASLRAFDQVAVLVQNSNGGFATSTIDVGDEPSDVAAGDFDGDGDLDLVAGLATDGNVTLLRNAGNTTFVAENVIVELDRAVATAGSTFRAVVHAADFNGNGRSDLAVGQTFADEVAVLSMDATGKFVTTSRVLVNRAVVALDSADLNADGRLDLLAANDDGAAHGMAVRLGRGNGAFQHFARLAVGSDPHAVATADFNSDGRLDLVATSFAGMSIQLGAGDGAFQPQRRIAADQPQAVVASDFNRDGRPDLAATFPFRGANSEVERRVGIWLGLGDGNFRDATFYTVGELPLDLVAGDFNGDGLADLAMANGVSNDVSLLLGVGDGTFLAGATLAAGAQPIAITTADVDRDGQLDLIVANESSDNITIWHGAGNGQFTRRNDVSVGDAPIDVLATDLDGDGRVDLVSANRTSQSLTTLYQESDGTFAAQTFALDGSPRSLAILAAQGNSAPRLAVTLEDQDRVVILEQETGRLWASTSEYPTGDTPIALVAADLNQDGRHDLAALNAFTHDVTVLFADGGDAFHTASDSNREWTQATPSFADWNADGTLDALVVRQSGEVLLRYGRPETPGVFDAPLAINPAARPALSAVAITTSQGTAIATFDRATDTVSIYRIATTGDWTLAREIPLDAASIRLTAGNINGDGLSDLAVAQAGSIALFMATASGEWQNSTIDTGVVSPAELGVFDADNDGSADLVLADGSAGTIRLYRSAGNGAFLPALVYRTGRGPYEAMGNSSAASLRALADTASQSLRSFEGTSSFIFGNFDGDALPDLLVLNSGANTFALLTGQGADGLSDPSVFPTGDRPSEISLGDFNRDGRADLAILLLGEERIGIYLGDGQGGFTVGPSYSAGNLPRGLAAIDVDRDGLIDLVIGNAFGDLMTFRGFGDGTFGPFTRAGQEMPLAVADLNGDGVPEVIVANAGLDRLSVQRASEAQPPDGALTADQIFEQQRTAGLLAPGAVEMADLDNDGLVDMLVANRGGNELLIYRGLGNGAFETARSFYAGTNPAGITIHDVNGDGRLDVVVANAGSNDVSVLLGDANELLRPGPRLAAGSAPVATVAGDFNLDGQTDLLVANSGSDSVNLLFGVGGGFFDDTQSIQFPTGADPRSLLVGQFDGRPGADLVTVNARGGSLTFYSNFLTGPLGGVTIATGGLRPTSAVARDFNDDGRLDVVVANNASGSLSVLLGVDAGLSLAAVVNELGFDHPSSLELIDFGGETGLRLLVTHEADEQPHVFTPKDFLPSATEPSGPLSPGSGLLLTLFQAGFRVLATSILIAPELPSNVAAFFAQFVDADANGPEAQAAGGAIVNAVETVNRLLLGADAIIAGLGHALDDALKAVDAMAKSDLATEHLPARMAAATAEGATSWGEMLGEIAAELAGRLDATATDVVLEEPEQRLAAPQTMPLESDEPGPLPMEPAREIATSSASTPTSAITPAHLEEPLPLPEANGEPRPLTKDAVHLAWPWQLWAGALAFSAAALGAGGYAAHRRRHRFNIETFED